MFLSCARSSGDRALPCGGRGRKFESCRAHHTHLDSSLPHRPAPHRPSPIAPSRLSAPRHRLRARRLDVQRGAVTAVVGSGRETAASRCCRLCAAGGVCAEHGPSGGHEYLAADPDFGSDRERDRRGECTDDSLKSCAVASGRVCRLSNRSRRPPKPQRHFTHPRSSRTKTGRERDRSWERPRSRGVFGRSGRYPRGGSDAECYHCAGRSRSERDSRRHDPSTTRCRCRRMPVPDCR